MTYFRRLLLSTRSALKREQAPRSHRSWTRLVIPHSNLGMYTHYIRLYHPRLLYDHHISNT